MYWIELVHKESIVTKYDLIWCYVYQTDVVHVYKMNLWNSTCVSIGIVFTLPIDMYVEFQMFIHSWYHTFQSIPSHIGNEIFRENYASARPLGLYSLSGKTSYRKISWSLEAARFGFKLFQSLWNLAGTSAALLPRCLSNFRAIRPLQHPISRLRDFTRFGGKTSYRLVNRGPYVLGLCC